MPSQCIHEESTQSNADHPHDDTIRLDDHSVHLDAVAQPGLSPDQLGVLRSYLDSREFAAGTVIFEEGSIGEELFILSTGQVSARTTLDHGRRIRLTTFSPGVVFGEMALLDGATRSATAIADSDAQCLVLPLASYRRLSDEHAEIALVITRNLGRLMAERLRLTNGQLRALEA